MANSPLLPCRVTVTAKDINGNNVAKTYNSVISLNFDYAKGMANIVDLVQGQYYFSLTLITSVTYTVAGTPPTTLVVMS